MSEQFRIEKVISSLPSTLSANTIYVVRVGNGYEMHVTDMTGAVAHKLNDENITKLQNRKLNFKNILAMSPANLTSDFFSFSVQTIQENIRYETNFPDYLEMDKLGIFQDQTYKLIVHYTYTKGTTLNDKLQVYINEQDTGTSQQIEEIDLSVLESGDYTYEKEFTANANYQFLVIDYVFENGANSTIKINTAGCYDKATIKENDIFDEDSIVPYNYMLTTVFTFAEKINNITQEVSQGNQQIKNQGVNLLHADYSNPQNALFSYSDYIFDVPWQIVDGFDKSVKAWEFDVGSSNANSKVIFNLNGYGNDILTPALRLNRSKYIFSFYAKTSDSNPHSIKFQLNSGVGIPYGVTEFDLFAGYGQYKVLLDLPQLNYAIQFFVNSKGNDGTGKKLIIERMMLEEISWQNFDVNDPNYVVAPSQFSEGIKNLGNTANNLTVEMREGFNSMNSWLNDLDSNKLDRGEYVQHFKGVYPSYAALTTAHPTAMDGDYAHIDSGQGFDRMGAIWDTSDTKWIVQSVNVGANTDEVPEGNTNLYFKTQRVLSTLLAGFSPVSGVIDTTDNIVQGISKAQGQITNIISTFTTNVRNTILSGVVLTDKTKVKETDSVEKAIGKLQAQVDALPSPVTWYNAKVIGTIHRDIDTSWTNLEFAKINGMLWIRGRLYGAISPSAPWITITDAQWLLNAPLTPLAGNTLSSAFYGTRANGSPDQYMFYCSQSTFYGLTFAVGSSFTDRYVFINPTCLGQLSV